MDVLVVGGGPAGLVTALLTAKAGLRTLVIERHGNFDREYRGEVLMPRFTQMFRELGLGEFIEELPHRKLEGLEIHYGRRRAALARFSKVCPDVPCALWMPQPVLLGGLHEKARALPDFDLWFDAHPKSLLRDGETVTGAVVERGGNRVEVRSRVAVGADGRFSSLRRLGGFDLAYERHDFDVLWFTIPEPAGYENCFKAFLSARGAWLALPKHPALIQCGMLVPPNGLGRYRSEGLAVLRRDLLRGPPLIHGFARALTGFEAFHPLQAVVDLVKTWAQDGILLAGDAAHTCSPAGAVGVSVAVQTAIAAAEVVVRSVRAGDVSAAALGEVQRRREADVRAVHRVQMGFGRQIASRSAWGRRGFALTIAILSRLGLFSVFPRRLLALDRPLGIPAEFVFKQVPGTFHPHSPTDSGSTSHV